MVVVWGCGVYLVGWGGVGWGGYGGVALTAIKTSKQIPCKWLYNPIIEITTVENIIEMLGNVIKH